jgi:hypothetical protein
MMHGSPGLYTADMMITSTLVMSRERALAYVGLFLIGLIGWLCDHEIGTRVKRVVLLQFHRSPTCGA